MKVDGLIKPEGETIAQAAEVSEDKKDENIEDEKPIKENALISLFRWISEKVYSPEEPYTGPYLNSPRGQK